MADVDFPDFVSGLLNGEFNAVVDSSIRQMEAYTKLVAAAAKSKLGHEQSAKSKLLLAREAHS